MDFLPSRCHFFTFMADYDQFWHVSATFNWLQRAIMSVGPGKSKFWTRHLRFSTWKTPVNRGPEIQSFYPFSPLLLFLLHASNPLKTLMKFYLAFNYSWEKPFPIYLFQENDKITTNIEISSVFN